MTPLNCKRSGCVTALYFCSMIPMLSAQPKPAITRTELPLKVKQGDLLVSAKVNGSRALTFKLDTGFGITTIKPSLVESLHLGRVGGITIDGIAGEERVATFRDAELDFGGMLFRPRRIAALGSEKQERSKARDGILGADFFRRFVVEIDIPARLLRLCEPGEFHYSGRGEVIPLQFKRDTPIIDGSIVTLSNEIVNGRFEIDTGCDAFLCLGQDFVAANELLDKVKMMPQGARRGVGGSTPIQHGDFEALRLGSVIIKKPSANFFLEGSPAGKGQAGHIGLGVLQRFNMTFDYSRRQMILEQKSD